MKRLNMKWIILGVVLLIPLFLGGVWYSGQRSLGSQLAALRAEGMPTNLEELNEFYAVPEGVEETTALWLTAFDAVEKADLSKRGKDLPIIGLNSDLIPPLGEVWAEFEAARTLINELEEELLAIHTASDAGGQVRLPVDLSAIALDGSFSQSARGVARLLNLASHVHSHEGDCVECLRDVQSLFGLSNAFQGEVTLIAYLVRITFHASSCVAVERMLPVCELNDGDLKGLQEMNRSPNFRDELIVVFQGERAYSLNAIDLLPLTVLRTANKSEVLRLYDILLEGLSISWADALKSQRELDAQLAALTGSQFSRMKYMAVLMLLQAMEHPIKSGARAEARQRCANAAIAARRYQLKHGSLPKSLEEIEQELLGPKSESSASLIDPFDGQPLRYVVEEDRVLIYSIGENEQDDGGDCENDTQARPLDIGFYLKK